MMHESGSRLYFGARILTLSCFQSVYSENSFDARIPWMLGDWNGQRTAQQQGFDCDFQNLALCGSQAGNWVSGHSSHSAPKWAMCCRISNSRLS